MGLLPVLGMPTGKVFRQLEVEFIMYDYDGSEIWRKAYVASEEQKVGLYKKKGREDERQLMLFRRIIQEFRQDVDRSSRDIRDQL